MLIAKSFPDYRKVLEALYAAQQASAVQANLSIPPDKYPGMPMRTEIDLNGQKFMTTLDSAEEANLPDDEFAVPADYKQITSPQSQEK